MHAARETMLLRETLGELDQNAPIGRILDFSEGHDEPQSFDDVEIDFFVPKQLQQFVAGVIRIISTHRAKLRKRVEMAIPEDELNELVKIISTAIEKARQLNMNTSAYILSMVLVEVREAAKAGRDNAPDDDTL